MLLLARIRVERVEDFPGKVEHIVCLSLVNEVAALSLGARISSKTFDRKSRQLYLPLVDHILDHFLFDHLLLPELKKTDLGGPVTMVLHSFGHSQHRRDPSETLQRSPLQSFQMPLFNRLLSHGLSFVRLERIETFLQDSALNIGHGEEGYSLLGDHFLILSSPLAEVLFKLEQGPNFLDRYCLDYVEVALLGPSPQRTK